MMRPVFVDINAFQRELEQAKDWPEDRLVEYQKSLARRLVEGTLDKSPVDTGFSRNNWQIDIDQTNEEVLGAKIRGTGINRSAAQIQSVAYRQIETLGPFQVIYWFNNAYYIRELEFGPGRSPQAPGGMVTVTIAEITVSELSGSS